MFAKADKKNDGDENDDNRNDGEYNGYDKVTEDDTDYDFNRNHEKEGREHLKGLQSKMIGKAKSFTKKRKIDQAAARNKRVKNA